MLAEDIVAGVRDALAERVARERLDNVSVRLGLPANPRLPDASFDRVLMVHMYHEVEQPYEFLWRMRPSLKPDGLVVVVDANRADPESRHAARPAALRVARRSVIPRSRCTTCRRPAVISPRSARSAPGPSPARSNPASWADRPGPNRPESRPRVAVCRDRRGRAPARGARARGRPRRPAGPARRAAPGGGGPRPRVTVFVDDDFRGRSMEITGPIRRLGPTGMEDKISAIGVDAAAGRSASTTISADAAGYRSFDRPAQPHGP